MCNRRHRHKYNFINILLLKKFNIYMWHLWQLGIKLFSPYHRQLWQWNWDHLIDHQHGGWYRIVARNGSWIEPYKSPAGKVDYHTMGACWDVLTVMGEHDLAFKRWVRCLADDRRGRECSNVRHPPWGGVEFFFKLQEGYLFRIKQPRAFTQPQA